jgi:hypothetical protein
MYALRSQEVVQSTETTLNEVEVTSSNPPSPSCMDMSIKHIYIYICVTFYSNRKIEKSLHKGQKIINGAAGRSINMIWEDPRIPNPHKLLSFFSNFII